jgi:predicted metal-binding membrane protein
VTIRALSTEIYSDAAMVVLTTCAVLMLTALAVGMTNLWWMAALAGVAFIEQVVPSGDRLRIPLGAALVSAALWQVLA